jgi:hypothetical protein
VTANGKQLRRSQPIRRFFSALILPPSAFPPDPRNLDPAIFTSGQREAVAWAENELDRVADNLWVMDASEGVQDFETAFRHLGTFVRQGCRAWVYDHVADASYKGSKDVSAFNHIVSTLKTANAAWHTTGWIVNQQSGNAAYNSHMGVVLPASVDHFFTILDPPYDEETKKPDKSIMQFALTASRWHDPLAHSYRQNTDSGLWLNHKHYPDEIEKAVGLLPYNRRPEQQTLV